jgi:hypothetical protein
MLDELCADSLSPCDSNMQEQDWENLGNVVDLESDIPWDGLPSGSAESHGSGADSLAANHAPLHFSNDNQDEFDISWLGSKQPKQSVHMQFRMRIRECSMLVWTSPSTRPPHFSVAENVKEAQHGH